MGKFDLMKTDGMNEIQINAGVLLSDFAPATGAVDATDILALTSGGINFTAVPSFVDLGEDIDNCPKNTAELKKLDAWDVKLTGSFVSMTAALAARLASGDVTDTTKVAPRTELKSADFAVLWLVGNYSDKTGATNGGYIAVKMLNTLSTGGFAIQTQNKGKGKFSFEFTAHSAFATPNVAPFEIYVKAGTAEPATT